MATNNEIIHFLAAKKTLSEFVERLDFFTDEELSELTDYGALAGLHDVCIFGAIREINSGITLDRWSSENLFDANVEHIIKEFQFKKSDFNYDLFPRIEHLDLSQIKKDIETIKKRGRNADQIRKWI